MLPLRLTYFNEVNFVISGGRTPVRLSPASDKLTSLSRRPISGGRVPNRGTLVTFSDVTLASSSHLTPEKWQWADGEGDGGGTQSCRAELEWTRRDFLRFKRVWRSDCAWRNGKKMRMKKKREDFVMIPFFELDV